MKKSNYVLQVRGRGQFQEESAAYNLLSLHSFIYHPFFDMFSQARKWLQICSQGGPKKNWGSAWQHNSVVVVTSFDK